MERKALKLRDKPCENVQPNRQTKSIKAYAAMDTTKGTSFKISFNPEPVPNPILNPGILTFDIIDNVFDFPRWLWLDSHPGLKPLPVLFPSPAFLSWSFLLAPLSPSAFCLCFSSPLPWAFLGFHSPEFKGLTSLVGFIIKFATRSIALATAPVARTAFANEVTWINWLSMIGHTIPPKDAPCKCTEISIKNGNNSNFEVQKKTKRYSVKSEMKVKKSELRKEQESERLVKGQSAQDRFGKSEPGCPRVAVEMTSWTGKSIQTMNIG